MDKRQQNKFVLYRERWSVNKPFILVHGFDKGFSVSLLRILGYDLGVNVTDASLLSDWERYSATNWKILKFGGAEIIPIQCDQIRLVKDMINVIDDLAIPPKPVREKIRQPINIRWFVNEGIASPRSATDNDEFFSLSSMISLKTFVTFFVGPIAAKAARLE